MSKHSAKMGLPKRPTDPPSSLPDSKTRPTRYVRNGDDAHLVIGLSSQAVPWHVIAKVLNRPWGVDVKTMKRHYREELAMGRASILVAAYTRIIAAIDDPDGLNAAFFLLKRHEGC